MKTKTILALAISAMAPFAVRAENIQGNMYVAPLSADTNHPAPTTDAYPRYGRIDIDTDDQGHIATTAYVKGAYNSAIAAVNKTAETVLDIKQDKLQIYDSYENRYIPIYGVVTESMDRIDGGTQLITALGIRNAMQNQRVEVYTTWNNDNATTPVALTTVSQ